MNRNFNTMSFESKVVIVTGSSSGIGAATAISFAKNGAEVVITGRNQEKLNNVAKKCSEFGKTPLLLKADIADEKAVISIIEKTVAKFGKLDILVNNAGYSKLDSIVSKDMVHCFDAVMNVNLRAVVVMTNLAVPHLIKTKGNIINVSSVLGDKPSAMISYAVSKAGLNHFTRCIALELAASGVRVNIVSPGPVETDFIENCGLPDSWENWEKKVPQKRITQPEEVADVILYLASGKAKSITGANFGIDNGALLV